MTPTARPEVLERLVQVPDKDWLDIQKVSKRHIQMKLKYYTLFGAHSERRLGMSAFEFYFHGAIEKLYDGTWDWKFEEFSLQEQIIRIINSMISEQVRKSKTVKDATLSLLYIDLECDENEHLLSDADSYDESIEKEQRILSFIALIEEAIDGNDDYEYLWLALRDGKSNDEICLDCGWSKKELYKKVELMKRMINRYAQNKKAKP